MADLRFTEIARVTNKLERNITGRDPRIVLAKIKNQIKHDTNLFR